VIRRFHWFALCVLLCALIGLASCRRTERTRPNPQSASTDTVRPSPAASSVPTPPVAQDTARANLLRRKGELLMARKRVLASAEMTRAQKDSALRVIEKESVELSKKLLDAGH